MCKGPCTLWFLDSKYSVGEDAGGHCIFSVFTGPFGGLLVTVASGRAAEVRYLYRWREFTRSNQLGGRWLVLSVVNTTSRDPEMHPF